MRKTRFIYVHGCMCVRECLINLLGGTGGEQQSKHSSVFFTGFITLFSANTLLPLLYIIIPENEGLMCFFLIRKCYHTKNSHALDDLLL